MNANADGLFTMIYIHTCILYKYIFNIYIQSILSNSESNGHFIYVLFLFQMSLERILYIYNILFCIFLCINRLHSILLKYRLIVGWQILLSFHTVGESLEPLDRCIHCWLSMVRCFDLSTSREIDIICWHEVCEIWFQICILRKCAI